MIGIYKITNKITGMVYIGQSVEVEERLLEHQNIPYRKNRPTYNYPLYIDIRKYGLNNFSFEIIKECEKEELNYYEQLYIKKYDSYYNGYNQTPGGDSVASGDLSNHHILTEKEVIDIRTRYNNHEYRWDVYQDYKEKINLDTFSHIWKGKTWKWCMPEVFTEDNIQWHEKHLGDKKQVKLSKISEQEVKYIRQQRKNGRKRKQVYEEFKNQLSPSGFDSIWYYVNWKGVE